MGVHETKTFMSGNSVAVRLPKALGIGPDERMTVERHGDVVTARRIPSEAEQAERLSRFRAALEEMRRIGPVGEVQERDPFEFPDRPGL